LIHILRNDCSKTGLARNPLFLILLIPLFMVFLIPLSQAQTIAQTRPTLGDIVLHTDTYPNVLPGCPFFAAMSFTLVTQRAADWTDPVLVDMEVQVREQYEPRVPAGTPHIPVGAISCVAIAVDNPFGRVPGEYDSGDTIISRAFNLPRDGNPFDPTPLDPYDPQSGNQDPGEGNEIDPLLAEDPAWVGWQHTDLRPLSFNVLGGATIVWPFDPYVGHPGNLEELCPGVTDPVYDCYINNEILKSASDATGGLDLGGSIRYMDVILERAPNPDRRYFVLVGTNDMMPDNARLNVSVQSIRYWPSLNPIDDASGTGGGPFINERELMFDIPAGQAQTLRDGVNVAVTANLGETQGLYTVLQNDGSVLTHAHGEAIDGNGIPAYTNAVGNAAGGLLGNSGPGYYPSYEDTSSSLWNRMETIIVGPHSAPTVRTAEGLSLVYSIELAGGFPDNPIFFNGFSMRFMQLGEYRELPGDGIDNDGDAIYLQSNGIDDNGDGEDNDGRPNTVAWADGIDNDGDGLIDEGIDDPMEGIDETYRITSRAFNGIDDLVYGSDSFNGEDNDGNSLTPPVADGKDNDGDGMVDEGIDEIEEGLGFDPTLEAGRNDDKDYSGIREAPFAYENGRDDNFNMVIDEDGEGMGPFKWGGNSDSGFYGRYFANINPLDPVNSDTMASGEPFVEYVTRTFIDLIELNLISPYSMLGEFVRWERDPDQNNRLMVVLLSFSTGEEEPFPVVYSDFQMLGFDNDFDNLYDEDPLDGMDNDNDGLVDEDTTWTPLRPSIDEERLDYFYDIVSPFINSQSGAFDSGIDEYYIDFNANGVFDFSLERNEYISGGQGYANLRDGETYFQIGRVYPLDNDGDGEENMVDGRPDYSTPAVPDGIDNDGDGWTDEGYNEDINDMRATPAVFLNLDSTTPAIRVLRDEGNGILDGTEQDITVSAMPDPFDPFKILVSFVPGDNPLKQLSLTDDFNWDFFVLMSLDSEDGSGPNQEYDAFGANGICYGEDFMMIVGGWDITLGGGSIGAYNYNVGILDCTNNMSVPDFWHNFTRDTFALPTGNIDPANNFQGPFQTQDGYPAGRLPMVSLSKRQVGRLSLQDIEGEERGLQEYGSVGGDAMGVFFENNFRMPPEPFLQYLQSDRSHSSNMTGPRDTLLMRQQKVMSTQYGMAMLQPDTPDTPKVLIGINASDAPGENDPANAVAREGLDEIRINFVDSPTFFSKARFDPSDLHPLVNGRESGVSLWMDRDFYRLQLGAGVDADGDGEDNDNNPNTPAVADGQDNDGDGQIDEGIDEDDIDFIDNDGDGLTDEDPVVRATTPGEFDSADIFVPMNIGASSWDPDPTDPIVRNGGHYVVLTPNYSLPLPGGDFTPDERGYEFFICVNSSANIDFLDSFRAFIRPGDILFTNGRNVGPGIYIDPVTSLVPTSVNAQQVGAVVANSQSLSVLGFNMHDSNNGFDPAFMEYDPGIFGLPDITYTGDPAPVRLRWIVLLFEDNPDSPTFPPGVFRQFTPGDLKSLTNVLIPAPNFPDDPNRLWSPSGVAIYRDAPGSDNNGSFDDPNNPSVVNPDTPVRLSGTEKFGVADGRPGLIIMRLDSPIYQGQKDVSPIDPFDPDPYEAVPPDDIDENFGDDFFVVIRTSKTIEEGQIFTVSIENPQVSNSGTIPGPRLPAFMVWPPMNHHLRYPGDTFIKRSIYANGLHISTATGRTAPLTNVSPFDAIPEMFFTRPEYVKSQSVGDPISGTYTIVWSDFDDQLDNDGDPSTYPEVNLYYVPQDATATPVLINVGGPINGSDDGIADSFFWNTTVVPPGTYRITGTIDDHFNPVQVALGGLVEVLNVPPLITLLTPPTDVTIPGGVFTLEWTDADPDNNAMISLYAVSATADMTNKLEWIELEIMIAEDPDGASDTYGVNIDQLLFNNTLERGGSYYFLAYIDDGLFSETRAHLSRSPGKITIESVPTLQLITPELFPPIQDVNLSYDILWKQFVPEGRSATLELFYTVDNLGYPNSVVIIDPIELPDKGLIARIPGIENLPELKYEWLISDGVKFLPTAPPQGIYYIYARITDDNGNVVSNFSAGRLQINERFFSFILTQNNEYVLDRYDIVWSASSPDPNAIIRLYYDDDNDGTNGRLIDTVSLFDASHEWIIYSDNNPADPQRVPVGSYFLYVVIDDNVPVADPSINTIYSTYQLSIGVPAKGGGSLKVLLKDGQIADPSGSAGASKTKSLLARGSMLGAKALRAEALGGEGDDNLYVLDDSGMIHATSGASAIPIDELGIDMAIDMEKAPGGGYYVLDAFGQIHCLGGALKLPDVYFGWDIARDMELTPDGGGAYVLDGNGQVHRVGNAPLEGSHALGVDIARDLELAPDGKGIYILDGHGGVHVSGSASLFPGPIFGSDVAVDLQVDPAGRGYYILDRFGGIHACGSVPPVSDLALGKNQASDLFMDADDDLGIFWTRHLIVDLNDDITFNPEPVTDGEYMAWVDSQLNRPSGSNIVYLDIIGNVTGVPVTLDLPHNQWNPSVDSGVLVFTSREGLDDDVILMSDLDDPSNRINLSRDFNVAGGTQGSDNQNEPDIDIKTVTSFEGPISVGAVVWSAFDQTNNDYDIYLQVLARGSGGLFEPVDGAITEISVGTNNSDQQAPSVQVVRLDSSGATILVAYEDDQNGDQDLLYAVVQVNRSVGGQYSISSVVVNNLVRSAGDQKDLDLDDGMVVYTDRSIGRGDIYSIKFNLADPSSPVPDAAPTAMASSLTRQFRGRVDEGESAAWITLENEMFDVIVSEPNILTDNIFPGMDSPRTIGLVSPVNGFADVTSLSRGSVDGASDKWITWTESRENQLRIMLYHQEIRKPDVKTTIND
jgi:hypothetical protein